MCSSVQKNAYLLIHGQSLHNIVEFHKTEKWHRLLQFSITRTFSSMFKKMFMSQSVAQREMAILIRYASVPITCPLRAATLVVSNTIWTVLAPYPYLWM
jgi:hypothetical protein